MLSLRPSAEPLGQFAQWPSCYRSLQELAPVEIVPTGNVFTCLADGHLGDRVHHPFEVVLTNPRRFAIRRGIAKVDRNGDAFAHGELYGIQIVTEELIQAQNALLNFLKNFFRRMP